MQCVFSRKGFDTSSGGGPSPIISGRPVSLPIPSSGPPETTYEDLGLGVQANRASKGKIGRNNGCHHDPMFLSCGEALLGQCGAAQTHLANQGVAVGDVFLFFGLFKAEQEKPHHRIFGYLRVETIIDLRRADDRQWSELRALKHPHVMAGQITNDTIYRGPGREARTAHPALRLTVEEGPPSLWNKPRWLKRGNLSYHDREDRWLPGSRLKSVARGQEFVSRIGRGRQAREWLDNVIAAIHAE